MTPVDRIDLLLIRHLQMNPRAPYAQIARSSGVSEPTVKRRIGALIREGYITPSVAPDIRRLGYLGSAYVGIRTDLDKVNEVAEVLSTMEYVTFVATTYGRYNILIATAQPSFDDLDRFIGSQLGSVPGVRDAEVMMISRITKMLGEWRIPIETEEPS